MQNRTRRLIKYTSDVLINPTKSLALVLSPSVFVIVNCIIFAVAETAHVGAHIKGAWDKYRKQQKSLGWLVGKIAIKTGRLIASLIGAVSLAIFATMANSAAALFLVPLYKIAFIISSVFSTLHKIRGLADYCTRQQATNFSQDEYLAKRNSLISRALIGVAGTALAITVILKVAFVVALIANPFSFAICFGIVIGMALYKARHVYNEYYHPKHGEENNTTSEDNSGSFSGSYSTSLSSVLTSTNSSPIDSSPDNSPQETSSPRPEPRQVTTVPVNSGPLYDFGVTFTR